jgi:hypothetical protein
MNSLTDLLYEYLLNREYDRLLTDDAYQQQKDTRDRIERALLATMTPRQRQLLILYEDQENALTAIVNRRRFSETIALLRRFTLLNIE